MKTKKEKSAARPGKKAKSSRSFGSIIKKVLKTAGLIVLWVLIFALILFGYFNLPVSNHNQNVQLGVTFSNRYAGDIGLDWKKTYIAMLDDLKVRKIRVPVYWDLVEPKEGQYDFSAIDWQLDQARQRNAEIILSVGQKVPRWPECAIPDWAKTSDQKRKESLLQFIDVVINRYKSGHPEIKYWQIENEPFLKFGICPTPDPSLLDSELALARKLDPTRQILVSDSGEIDQWFNAYPRADIFGTTLYRTIWKNGIGYFQYPLGPRFYQFKYWINSLLFGKKPAYVIELQAEPWINGYTTNQPLSEQFKSMNVVQLKANVDYAEKVGFPGIYLWGVEWWYWLKYNKNHPELWDAAKTMFQNQSQL